MKQIEKIAPQHASMSGGSIKLARFFLEQDFDRNVANSVVVEMGESLTSQAISDIFISPGMSSFTPLHKLFLGEMMNAAGPQSSFNPDKIREFLGGN